MSAALKLEQKSVQAGINALIRIGKVCYEKNWSLATSSNYSIVLQRDPLMFLMTASGKHKGNLQETDFVVVNEHGAILCDVISGIDVRLAKPSAETMLHVMLAKHPSVGAVLHTHSIWSTLLSGKHAKSGQVRLAGYEMLKAIDGVRTHDTYIDVPVFENTQKIDALAVEIENRGCLLEQTNVAAFLIAKHGLYVTGSNVDDAMRHIEAFEFLFELTIRAGE